MEKICAICGNRISGRGRLYCSRKCYKAASKPNNPRVAGVKRSCAQCGKDFWLWNSEAKKDVKHCSFECRKKSWGGVETNCPECGKVVHRKKHQVDSGTEKGLYCSKECWNNWNNRRLQNKTLDEKIERINWRITKRGYVVGCCIGHPIGQPSGSIEQHWHNYWNSKDREEWVVAAKNNGATLHHMNGDRSDNRPENLEMWERSHPPGQRLSDKLNWAKEILEKYQNAKL
jgi:hypothetical protein